MSNNLVKEWSEFNKLQECPSLEDLLFVGLCHLQNNSQSAEESLPLEHIIKKIFRHLIYIYMRNSLKSVDTGLT